MSDEHICPVPDCGKSFATLNQLTGHVGGAHRGWTMDGPKAETPMPTPRWVKWAVGAMLWWGGFGVGLLVGVFT